jgi:hypothetical protein
MEIKEFIKKYYIEIIIAVVLLLLFYSRFYIEAHSHYIRGDYMNRSGKAVLKFFLSLIKK